MTALQRPRQRVGDLATGDPAVLIGMEVGHDRLA
jgi:hypothetical protein